MPSQQISMEFEQLSVWGALSACFGLSCLFVLSLYVVDPGLSRNHPKTVRRRLQATLCVCLVAPLYLWLFSDTSQEGDESLLTLLGVRWKGLLPAVVSPLLLVLVLYAGPIIQSIVDGESLFEHITSERVDINIRNYLLAPFAEEFVFRACMLPLLTPQFGPWWSVLICPLFFGLAHVHHLVEWCKRGNGVPISAALASIALQVCYTTIFGMFSAFLLLRTGHLISPVLSHALCNMLGLPSFEALPTHSYRTLLMIMYVVGLVSFFSLLNPLTHNTLFQ